MGILTLLSIYPALLAYFFGQNPADIIAGKCEITPAGLGMDSKAPQIICTAGGWGGDNAKKISIKLKHLSLVISVIPWPCRGHGYK